MSCSGCGRGSFKPCFICGTRLKAGQLSNESKFGDLVLCSGCLETYNKIKQLKIKRDGVA